MLNDFINQFPYSDFHEINLDWILKRMEELALEMQAYEAAHQISYEDIWDITKQYTAWSIVYADGHLYMSVKPVPAGIDISNTDYWMNVLPFSIDTDLSLNSYNAIANRTVTNMRDDLRFKIDKEESERIEADSNLSASDVALSYRIDGAYDALTAQGNLLSSLNTQVQGVDARIDNLAQVITPGSTSGDAELADIRVGENGILYPNAGDAVRGQVSELNNEINIIKGININSFTGLETAHANISSAGSTEGQWTSVGSDQYTFYIVPVPTTGCTLAIDGSVYGTYYAGLKTYSAPASGVEANFSDTWTSKRLAPAAGETVTIPDDVKIILIWTLFNNIDFTPDSFSITNADYSGLLSEKQDLLVSGTNIKTINDQSLLGSGNIDIIPVDFMSMFNKIGMIGDSLASGELTWLDDNPEGGTWKPDEQKYYHGVDIYDNAWLSYICKAIDSTPVFYAKGGVTLASWFTDYYATFQTDDPCNAYYIALGTNDVNEPGFTLGTVADATTDNTYCGKLKKLIEAVHAHAPDAAVFLMTLYGNVGANPQAVNAIIPDIADLYSYVYCIDFVNESDITKTVKDNDYTSEYHFTTNGYIRVASNIRKITNDVINTNQTDFKFFALNNMSHS